MKCLSAFILTMISMNAFAVDVHGEDPYFIRVNLDSSKQFAKFDLCKTATPDVCKALGARDAKGASQYYRIVDLENQQLTESAQVVGSVVGDVVGVVGLVWGGAIAGGAVLGAGFGVNAVAATGIGGAVGLTGSVASMVYWDSLNPAVQYRQARIIRDDVITDLPVVLSAKMTDYAEALHTVLLKLKPYRAGY